MKIIKQGVHPEEIIYHATCRFCKTEVEFQKKEAKFNSGVYRDGDWLEIACPVCNHTIVKGI